MKPNLSKDLSSTILDCAFEVHRRLGPGLLESTYQHCLHYELLSRGMKVEKEKPIPVIYKDVKLECGYRLDLLVNNSFLIEVKSVESLAPIHTAQTLTYLKLAELKIGLLINFNEELLKNGIKRIVNGYKKNVASVAPVAVKKYTP